MENKKEEVIRLLPFPDNVRHRASMYLGGLDNATVPLREICDNSCDIIAESGKGDTILISNDFNGFLFVADNSLGIPISMSIDKPKMTQAALSILSLHSGSKFEAGDTTRVGLNGVGSAAVNACSEVYVLLSKITDKNYNTSIKEVYDCWIKAGPREKKNLYYIIVCEKGKKVYEGAGKLGDLEKKIFKGIKNYISIPKDMNTIVLFRPDPTIFESTHADIPIKNLQYYLLIQEKFYGRKINVIVDGGKISSQIKPYKFEILRTIVPKDNSVNKQVGVYLTFEVDPSLGPKVENGSVNGLDTNRGQHIQIAESVLKTALKEHYKIKHDCLLNGMQFCMIVLANECQFNSQTKENLKAITKVKLADFAPIVKDIIKIFKKDPEYWDIVVEKLNQLAESMKSIGAIDKAARMMDSLSGVSQFRAKANFPKTFADATSRDRSNCELFIVEGNSAQGSLVMGRPDTKAFAILGLRGKILNVTDKGIDRALESKVIGDIFNIIGLGLDVNWVGKDAQSYEEAHDIIMKKSRYSKIIIATDADADGSGIFNELVYLFSKFARFLVDHGMVYRALSPLFRGISKKTGQMTYYYPDDPCDPKTTLPLDLDTKKHYDRWKGLASLSPETGEVYDSFFNPKTRRLVQITPEGLEYARKLNEDINERKDLLFNKGILSNPYNFKDL